MTRKFLFCFPLRLGNIVFGYILLIISIALILYNLYELALCFISADEPSVQEKFAKWQGLDYLFSEKKEILVAKVAMSYYASYVIIGFLLFIFTAIFMCGAYKANHCLVTTFFVYSFFHLFFTIGLVVWEATSEGWIQLGLIIASDLLLILCLFSVKYLMEAISNGNIYSSPGEVLYKYY